MKRYTLLQHDRSWNFTAICFLAAFNQAKDKYESMGLIGSAYLCCEDGTKVKFQP